MLAIAGGILIAVFVLVFLEPILNLVWLLLCTSLLVVCSAGAIWFFWSALFTPAGKEWFRALERLLT